MNGTGSISVLAASDSEERASAARLAAEVDTGSDLGTAVRELLEDVANGEQVVVMRMDRELTPAGAADLLGVTRQFLDRLLADGRLPFRRLPDSRHRRVRVADVLALAAERERRRRGAEAIRQALHTPG